MKKILFESKRLSELAGIITENITSVTEGVVVDMFSPEKSAVLSIANALAKRAMEMLGIDGKENDSSIGHYTNLFLSPYIDFDGHKGMVPALADHIYTSYVSDKAGGQAHTLEDIVARIDIDYFDEDLQYAAEALGDDGFTMPSTWKSDEDDPDDDPNKSWNK
jgi:hypothetical protein